MIPTSPIYKFLTTYTQNLVKINDFHLTGFSYICAMPLFSRKPAALKDFSILGTDIHNHVLPGLDDGAPSVKESLAMLEKWQELGYKKVIATPHVINALYPNTRDQILGELAALRQAWEDQKIRGSEEQASANLSSVPGGPGLRGSRQVGISVSLQDDISLDEQNRKTGSTIPIELEASAEYHLDYEFNDLLKNKQLIPFGDNNYVLIELPFQQPSFSVDEILYEIQLAGYEPIIAHPERYNYLNNKLDTYTYLKDRNLLFQLNMLSLTGQYGIQSKRMAEKLIDHDMYEFVGSDAHHTGHLEELKKLLKNKHFIKLVESGRLRNKEL